jgi:putative transposase
MARIAPVLPEKETSYERPHTWPLRDIVNGILYIAQSGCSWRMMPHDLPPWQTLYWCYWQWRDTGLWEQINTILVQAVRVKECGNPSPCAAPGSTTARASRLRKGEECGMDVHKQVCGRKRHIIVDTLGLLLLVLVHRASLQDGNGVKLLLQGLFDRIKHSLYTRWCRFKLIWADGGYEDIVGWVRKQFG